MSAPYSVRKLEPQTVLREVTLGNGTIVSMCTPDHVTWAVVIGGQGILWDGRDTPVIFHRKGVAELEAAHFNRIAEDTLMQGARS